MGVGDENGGKQFRGQSQRVQRRGDPAAGDPGVQQQVGIAAGEDSGIPGGAAGKSMYGGKEKYLTMKRNVRQEPGRSRPEHSLTDVKFS